MKKLTPDQILSTEPLVLDEHQLDAFLSMAIPVVVVDLEKLNCVIVNDAALKVYGYTTEEFANMRLFDLHLRIPIETLKFRSSFSNSNTITLNNLVHKLKDGGNRNVNAIITRYQYQGRDVMVGLLGDAFPDAQNEGHSFTPEANFENLFQELRIPLLIVDPRTQQFITVNPAACLFYGYSLDEFKAKKIVDLFAEPDPEFIKGSLKEVSSGNLTSLQVTHKLNDGSERMVEIHPFRSTVQGSDAVLVLVRDIQELETAKLDFERQYTGLFENLSAPLLVFEQGSLNLIDVNKAACEFYGYKEKEFLKKSIWDLSLSSEEQIQREKKALDSSGSGSFVVRHRMADGSIRNVRLFVNPTIWKGRNVYVALAHDNESESRMRNLERNVTDLLDNLPVMAALYKKITDADGNTIDLEIAYINKLGAANHDKQPEEMIGTRISEIFSKRILERDIEIVGTLEEDGSRTIEQYLEDRDLHLEVTYYIFDEQQVVILAKDISTRKQLINVLEKASLEQEKLIDSIPAMIWKQDLEDLSIVANKPWLEYTGLEQAHEALEDWIETIHPDDRKANGEVIREARKAEAPFEIEQRIRGKDRQYSWFLTKANPHFGADGEIDSYYEVNIDISENKKIMEELAERIKELTAINKMTRLVENKSRPLQQFFQNMADILIEGFWDPENVAVRVELEDAVYHSAKFTAELTNRLVANLVIDGEIKGEISVFNLDDTAFILPEEQNMLSNIAHRFEDWYRQRKYEMEIRSLIYSINQVPVGIVIMDPEGTIQFTNLHTQVLTGFAQEEMVGKKPAFCDSGAEISSRLNDLKGYQSVDAIITQEVRITQKDGNKVWVNQTISPTFGPNDEVMNFVMTIENIEKRIIDRERIGQALSFNKAILEASPSGILVFSSDFKCVSANIAAFRLFEARDVNDLTIFDLKRFTAENHFTGLIEKCRTVLRTKIPESLVLEVGTEEGGTRSFEFDLTPFKTENTTQLIMFTRDATERRKRHKETERMNKELVQAIEKLELANNSLSKNSENLRIIRQMDELLMLCRSNAEAYKVFKRFSALLFPRISLGIYSIDQNKQMIELEASIGESVSSSNFSTNDCWAMRRGKPHHYEKANDDLRCDHLHAEFDGSSLGIPFSLMGGETRGLMHFEFPNADHISQDDLVLANSLTEHMSLALSNIQMRQMMEEQSKRDPLTSVYNRRQMSEMLDHEITKSDENGQLFSLLELDIDHFKKYNDTYGHPAGDHVLVQTANKINSLIRGSDTLFRVGGEEFVILMPGASLEVGISRAELLRSAISEQELKFEGRSLGNLTISIGVACYPDHAEDIEALFSKMDKALYKAKANGRDQVVAV